VNSSVFSNAQPSPPSSTAKGSSPPFPTPSKHIFTYSIGDERSEVNLPPPMTAAELNLHDEEDHEISRHAEPPASTPPASRPSGLQADSSQKAASAWDVDLDLSDDEGKVIEASTVDTPLRVAESAGGWDVQSPMPPAAPSWDVDIEISDDEEDQKADAMHTTSHVDEQVGDVDVGSKWDVDIEISDDEQETAVPVLSGPLGVDAGTADSAQGSSWDVDIDLSDNEEGDVGIEQPTPEHGHKVEDGVEGEDDMNLQQEDVGERVEQDNEQDSEDKGEVERSFDAAEDGCVAEWDVNIDLDEDGEDVEAAPALLPIDITNPTITSWDVDIEVSDEMKGGVDESGHGDQWDVDISDDEEDKEETTISANPLTGSSLDADDRDSIHRALDALTGLAFPSAVTSPEAKPIPLTEGNFQNAQDLNLTENSRWGDDYFNFDHLNTSYPSEQALQASGIAGAAFPGAEEEKELLDSPAPSRTQGLDIASLIEETKDLKEFEEKRVIYKEIINRIDESLDQLHEEHLSTHSSSPLKSIPHCTDSSCEESTDPQELCERLLGLSDAVDDSMSSEEGTEKVMHDNDVSYDHIRNAYGSPPLSLSRGSSAAPRTQYANRNVYYVSPDTHSIRDQIDSPERDSALDESLEPAHCGEVDVSYSDIYGQNRSQDAVEYRNVYAQANVSTSTASTNPDTGPDPNTSALSEHEVRIEHIHAHNADIFDNEQAAQLLKYKLNLKNEVLKR
jgi:hypothetical protein